MISLEQVPQEQRRFYIAFRLWFCTRMHVPQSPADEVVFEIAWNQFISGEEVVICVKE